ncbi:hypothetical protein CHLRE_17g747997v5 [Chlamydomonas reinhardtii]|uniref:Endonuclease/exonuclease/phosphatase domain-containing protein n=1 Tax=Chlamydomonas reinhardtii TaxID=3055 RepID=A0A2K3CS65_CHLRE|nr:uncharacterized protein CHLRE_17g747997v5 [Chlamydomonas reinhardtii]PNW71133.1 hypothetical protein CHLRE_17g747997v5 [Chlamydomonas reinhardtii]
MQSLRLPGAARRVAAAALIWAELRLDIICLQETHWTCRADQAAFEQTLQLIAYELHLSGWKVTGAQWSTSRATAGVAFLVRQELWESSTITAPALSPVPTAMLAGRLAVLKLRWGGRSITIANTYFPAASTHAAEQAKRELISQLRTQAALSAAATAGEVVIWAGDFNFVENPALDSSAGPGGRPGDAPLAALLRAADQPQMVDMYRHRHPTARCYSHLYRAPVKGGSRLDRIYVSAAAAAAVCHADIALVSSSDHRPAFIDLLPAPSPGPRKGRARRRMRLFFHQHPDLRQQLEGWLEAEAGTAPTEDNQRQALLAWWPLFKMRLSVKVAQLNRVAQMRRLEHGQRTRTAQAAQAAAEAAHQSNPTEATRMALVDAASEVQAATRADAAHPAHKARVAWLHSGERPSRVLTRVLAHDRPSGSNAGPPALRTAHGALVGDPIQKAQCLADFFTGISAQPPTTVAARAAVLQTVRDHGAQLTTEDDTTAGGLTVTCEEVQKALKQTQPGKAPGWDGIPADLYKAYRAQLGPLLATLYTAIGQTGQMPHRFT